MSARMRRASLRGPGSGPAPVSANPSEQLLIGGAAELDIALTRHQVDQLLQLSRELGEWNSRFNLTAIRDERAVVVKHFLDSLTVLPHLRGTSVADVGTGAGFPGLPLAIAAPACGFTLIEATAKKANFVQHVVTSLGLRNVTVVVARAEKWKPAAPVDSVVSRALSTLGEFVQLAGHLCRPGGWLLAMKGRLPDEEIAALPARWRVTDVYPLRVPGLDAHRHLVVMQRAADVARGSR